jgi:hypothetical protein
MPSSGMWRHVDLGCSHMLTLVPRSRIFYPEDGGDIFPPKRQFTRDLHGATSQKTAFFKTILL